MTEWLLIIQLFVLRGPVLIDMPDERTCMVAASNFLNTETQDPRGVGYCVNRKDGRVAAIWIPRGKR